MALNKAGGELFGSFTKMMKDVAAGYAELWSRITGIIGSTGSTGSAASGAAGGATNAAAGLVGSAAKVADGLAQGGTGILGNLMGALGGFYKRHPLIATALLAGSGVKLLQDRGQKRELQAKLEEAKQMAMDQYISRLERAAVCEYLGESNPTPRSKNYWQSVAGRTGVTPATDPSRTGTS